MSVNGSTSRANTNAARADGTADGEFLDTLFERALSESEEGVDLDLDSLLHGREDLRARAQEVVRLAREVTPGVSRGFPCLPGYSVVSELGRGGMGAVYLCRQESLGGRPVAVKVLPRDFLNTPHGRERFRAEATALARLRHPNVVVVHELVEADEASERLLGLAMEWIPGLSLSQLLEQLNALSATDRSMMTEVSRLLGSEAGVLDRDSYVVFIARIGAVLASALDAVHRAGLLHRDVKPSNILITPEGRAMLTDFGLASNIDTTRSGSDPKQRGTFAGTPAYAAPEQLRTGGEPLSPATDVYGLGATLYHALARRPAVDGHSAPRILRQIESGGIRELRALNPSVPRDLETIVARAMDPDPAKRYHSAAEMGEDLERLLRLQPIRARPGGRLARALKRVRRNRASVFAAAGAAVTTTAMSLLLVFAVFLAPGWAQADVQRARLALLDEFQVNAIFNLMFFGEPGQVDVLPLPEQGVRDWRARTLEKTAVALPAYRSAVRLTPLDGDIALERDVILLVRACLEVGTQAPVPARVRKMAPSVPRYLTRWTAAGSRPHTSDEELVGASHLDLRSLGLLAALLGDMDTALRAWTRLDVDGLSDPLVDAWLGIALIADDQPARAYPRLRLATQAFPNTGFIHTFAAEAAARCGDFPKARRLIEQAAHMPHGDDAGAWDRVEGLINALQSPPDAARAIYEHLCHKDQYTAIRGRDYLRFLIQQGDWSHARIWSARQFGDAISSRRLAEQCVGLGDAWWERLGLEEREAFVRGMAVEKHAEFLGWPWRDWDFVSLYGKATQLLTQGENQPESPKTAALAGADASPFLQRAGLRDLAGVVNVQDWTQLASMRATDPDGWAARATDEWIAGRVYPR